jgi:hypothetical protein
MLRLVTDTASLSRSGLAFCLMTVLSPTRRPYASGIELLFRPVSFTRPVWSLVLHGLTIEWYCRSVPVGTYSTITLTDYHQYGTRVEPYLLRTELLHPSAYLGARVYHCTYILRYLYHRAIYAAYRTHLGLSHYPDI